MEIKDHIKEQRNKLGITQQQLAYDTGLSIDGIRSIESGRAKPNVETIVKLADRFNCSVDYLLNREPHVLPEQTHAEHMSLVALSVGSLERLEKLRDVKIGEEGARLLNELVFLMQESQKILEEKGTSEEAELARDLLDRVLNNNKTKGDQ